MPVIKVIEVIAYAGKRITLELLVPLTGIAQNMKLQIKEFFKFKPVSGFFESLVVAGEMYFAQGLVQRHQTQFFEQKTGQGFGNRSCETLKQGNLNFLNCFGIQKIRLHPFRCVVKSLQAPGKSQTLFVERVNVGVGNRQLGSVL